MKKIVSGIRYDTEKATEIGYYQTMVEKGDFQWWEAALYVTPRSKRYFLAGSGGPLTMFGQIKAPGQWSVGRGIKLLTEAEALSFAERYLPTRQVEKFFGEIIKDA